MLELIELEKEMTITNPSTGATIETLNETSFDEASKLINEAKNAQINWAKTPIKERAQVFYKYLELLINSKEELAKLVHLENGKTLSESIAEVEKSIELTEYACSLPQIAKGDLLEVSKGVT